MRILHLCMALAMLGAASVMLPACSTVDPPGPVTVAAVETVDMESTRALALANEAYLAANSIATKAIKAGLIKGEALQTVGRLDRQINALLDKAGTAREAVQRASAIREATGLILEFRDLVAPFKGMIYGRNGTGDRYADRAGLADLSGNSEPRRQRPRYSG